MLSGKLLDCDVIGCPGEPKVLKGHLTAAHQFELPGIDAGSRCQETRRTYWVCGACQCQGSGCLGVNDALLTCIRGEARDICPGRYDKSCPGQGHGRCQP